MHVSHVSFGMLKGFLKRAGKHPAGAVVKADAIGGPCRCIPPGGCYT